MGIILIFLLLKEYSTSAGLDFFPQSFDLKKKEYSGMCWLKENAIHDTN